VRGGNRRMCMHLVSDAHYMWGVNTNFINKHVDLYVLMIVIIITGSWFKEFNNNMIHNCFSTYLFILIVDDGMVMIDNGADSSSIEKDSCIVKGIAGGK
jgi:hypothetical protein